MTTTKADAVKAVTTHCEVTGTGIVARGYITKEDEALAHKLKKSAFVCRSELIRHVDHDWMDKVAPQLIAAYREEQTATLTKQVEALQKVLEEAKKLINDYAEVHTMWSGDSFDLARGAALEPTLIPRTNELNATLASTKGLDEILKRTKI